MLVLTRRAGETLHIGDAIKLVVLWVKGNQVRFGIEAPRDMRVRRNEAGAQMGIDVPQTAEDMPQV